MDRAEFIQKSQSKFGDRFSFEYTEEFSNVNDVVTITCPDHGKVQIKAHTHLKEGSAGCVECSKVKRAATIRTNTINKFIREAAEKYDNKYDYSLLEETYTGKNNYATIICPKHGPITITPYNHLKSKYGCYECYVDAITKEKEEFIQEATIRYKGKYDYSLVEYTKNDVPVRIICPEHGEFTQQPNNHLQGKIGCNKCVSADRSHSWDSFLEKAQQIHGTKFTFVNEDNKSVTVVCPEHGNSAKTWRQVLHGGGCNKCSNSHKRTQEEFVAEATQKHNGKYTYENSVFTRVGDKINITCPEHGSFWQSAHSHLAGQGCSKCAKTGYNPNKTGMLYYLRVETEGQVAYKIGITNLTVQERYTACDRKYITILKEWIYHDGQDALNKETWIKREFKQYKYNGHDLLSSGNSELFSIDILGLDINEESKSGE